MMDVDKGVSKDSVCFLPHIYEQQVSKFPVIPPSESPYLSIHRWTTMPRSLNSGITRNRLVQR
ncbi:hypothetical protein BT69DRAFT_1282872 [Atractiella rhizophila]|nr:hypothetical protein BT69DRAFT_1282872 [Atractiella rhizophila]